MENEQKTEIEKEIKKTETVIEETKTKMCKEITQEEYDKLLANLQTLQTQVDNLNLAWKGLKEMTEAEEKRKQEEKDKRKSSFSW